MNFKGELTMDMPTAITSFLPTAWEGEQVPQELDGSNGINRATVVQWTGARNDSEAIQDWLRAYEKQVHTYRSYKKEALRLLLWAVLERRKAMSSLLADDFEAYFDFLENPPEHWIGTDRSKRGSSSWTPFRRALTPASVKQAKSILNTMMTWLVSARYLSGNPMSILRTPRSSLSKKPKRYLRTAAWQFVLTWLSAQPEESNRQRQEKIRNQVLISILYLTAARLADIAQARMGDLEQDEFGNWWWNVVGKGNKEANIPITNELMTWISAYRVHYHLSPLPSPNEQSPLIFRIADTTGECLSPNMIYRIVKHIMVSAGKAAEEQGLSEIAVRLNDATTHWIRHTSLTHQAMAGMDILTIRDNARHDSIKTTSLYLSTEDQLRHRETSEKFRLQPSPPTTKQP